MPARMPRPRLADPAADAVAGLLLGSVTVAVWLVWAGLAAAVVVEVVARVSRLRLAGVRRLLSPMRGLVSGLAGGLVVAPVAASAQAAPAVVATASAPS